MCDKTAFIKDCANILFRNHFYNDIYIQNKYIGRYLFCEKHNPTLK